MVQIRDTFNRPIICGEAGFDIDKEHQEFSFHLIEDMLTLFTTYDVSWVRWCYKEAQFMGMAYPKSDSSWIKFTDKVHEKWDHYAEIQLAKDGGEWLEDKGFGTVPIAKKKY